MIHVTVWDRWKKVDRDLSEYARALALLEEAIDLMESVGDTLIAAHLTTPLGLVQDRLDSLGDPPCPA